MNKALFERFDELFARISIIVYVVFVYFGARKVFFAAGDEVSAAIYSLEL